MFSQSYCLNYFKLLREIPRMTKVFSSSNVHSVTVLTPPHMLLHVAYHTSYVIMVLRIETTQWKNIAFIQAFASDSELWVKTLAKCTILIKASLI